MTQLAFEEDIAGEIMGKMEAFDNLYGEINMLFKDGDSLCEGNLLIADLRKDWKRNLMKLNTRNCDEIKEDVQTAKVDCSPVVLTQRTTEILTEVFKKVDTTPVKTTLKSKRVNFEIPVFNLNTLDDKDLPVYKGDPDGKKKVNEVEETQQALVVADVGQPRRIRFLTEAYCSPYKKMAVELNKRLTQVEINISDYMFAAFGEYLKVVFKSDDSVTI